MKGTVQLLRRRRRKKGSNRGSTFLNIREWSAKVWWSFVNHRFFKWPFKQHDSCDTLPPWPLSTVNQKLVMKITWGGNASRSFKFWRINMVRITRDTRLKLQVFWLQWKAGLKTTSWLQQLHLNEVEMSYLLNFFLTFLIFASLILLPDLWALTREAYFSGLR